MPDELLPHVSIVIPALNEESYLAACLTSLLALSHPKERHEILVVDNGSTDRTLEIAREFSEVSIKVKGNAKVGAVRNYGVQKAKDSDIGFLVLISPSVLSAKRNSRAGVKYKNPLITSQYVCLTGYIW